MTETLGAWAGIGDFDCRVVDPTTGQEVAAGEQGEFLVRGYSVLQGLYKHEREDVFTPDGFFPTGDLGYLENGLVYFQGRTKDMIKTKGANVAPAEVEAALNYRCGKTPRTDTSPHLVLQGAYDPGSRQRGGHQVAAQQQGRYPKRYQSPRAASPSPQELSIGLSSRRGLSD
jgi:hypothetical protein